MALRSVLPGGREREAKLLEAGARVVATGDAEYPALLREIPRPPARLWLRGRPLTAAPAVAVVGSRRASRAGLDAARLSREGLARAGVVVVSGFARGVDAAAHRAALEDGGKTVGRPRLRRRRLLPGRARAAAGGDRGGGTAPLGVPIRANARSPTLPGAQPDHRRLSRLVVVVEAAEKSGSLITARCAAEVGRDVAAVPGPDLAAGARGRTPS